MVALKLQVLAILVSTLKKTIRFSNVSGVVTTKALLSQLLLDRGVVQKNANFPANVTRARKAKMASLPQRNQLQNQR